MMIMMNCVCCMVDLMDHGLALLPAGTIVRDPHHGESRTWDKQDLHLCRTWVHDLLNEVLHKW